MLPEEMESLLEARGLEGYRSRQIVEWLYIKDARAFKDMTNLPARLREELAEEFRIADLKPANVQISRSDRTKKFLFALDDGRSVETVLMPEAGNNTACISTQVGCSFGCLFCASGKRGLGRNLTAGEIVDQARHARFDPDAGRLSNIVLMGMGEPLANYEASATAVRIFQHERCFALGKRRVTISTAGYAPGIRKLAGDNLAARLAISLHATDDETRSRLMPINKKYPIKELISALRPLAGNPQTPLTIEYMLIEGVNDSLKQARALARICATLSAKVNLIAYNPAVSGDFVAPPEDKVLRFQATLREEGILAFIRRSRGLDIDGACGQLRSSSHKHSGESPGARRPRR
jgi:23S rRNA (adenine2503-C2)-methyltransferase